MIIFEPKERIAEYVIQRIGSDNTPDDLFRYVTIGLIKDNKLVAGLIYYDYTGTSISVHIGGHPNKRWLTKELLKVMFHYPFIQLGVNRITGYVAAKNKDAIKFDEKLGFVREGVLRKATKDDDLIVYGMLREECRWINKET